MEHMPPVLALPKKPQPLAQSVGADSMVSFIGLEESSALAMFSFLSLLYLPNEGMPVVSVRLSPHQDMSRQDLTGRACQEPPTPRI